MAARVIDLRKGKAPPTRMKSLPFPQQDNRPRRPSPLKARRRRVRLAAIGMVLILALALAYAVHLASYMGPLSISSVSVVGVKKIEPTIVESYVDSQLDDGSFHYMSRRNIFFYPKQVLEEGIVASFPRVRSAQLSRAALFSTELRVTVEEREPYALWCASEADCYAVDDSGFVFTTAATTTHGEFATSYVFSGDIEGEVIGKRFVPGQFPSLVAVLRVLQQETNLIPSRVRVMQGQDFTVFVEQGFSVKASFGQEPETLARNLDLVLSSEAMRERIADIEYIDLRFGNRVYYKMKGEEQTNI